MNLRETLLVLPALLAMAGSARAVQIDWGCEVDTVLRDSMGVPLDETFYVQLGYFAGALDGEFTPTGANTAEWADHWQTFDQAAFDPASGYFTSTVSLNFDGSSGSAFATNATGIDFSNKKAYLWIFNSRVPGARTQWFLGNSPGWQIPDKPQDCCDPRAPLEWSVSDLGPADTPVFGRQGELSGAGQATVTGAYDLQTFAVVPEPSAPLLVALAALAGALVRRRPTA